MACTSVKKGAITPPSNPKLTLIDSLIRANPQYFQSIIDHAAAYKVQVIYTQIDRDAKNNPHFTHHHFNLNEQAYFYPASTVKMPMAFMALEKINQLAAFGVDKNSLLSTDSTSTPKTIAEYIKEIFLVSDNDAFNRLYDFVGQASANAGLHQRGYTHSEILHRLSVALTAEQNKQTPAIQLRASNGKVLYEQPAAYNTNIYSQRQDTIGSGYYAGGKLIMQPMDFSTKNRMPLADLQQMLQAVLFSTAVPKKQRFNLTEEDYQFLYRYMSAYPRESGIEKYDNANYWDAYVKFLLLGSAKGNLPGNIRIFNKVGNAYGQLTDVAYIVDFEHKVEFMLSATIYCNSDGILNDDKYDYDTVGFPFMKHLGQVVYDFERKRTKQYQPDLSRFNINY
jgi:cell division protein FtsI/penicillin-binding protein 2